MTGTEVLRRSKGVVGMARPQPSLFQAVRHLDPSRGRNLADYVSVETMLRGLE